MAGSLREALESAVAAQEDVINDAPAAETVAPIDKVDDATIAASEAVGEKNNAAAAAEDKAKADRARDGQGRFVEQAKDKPAQKSAPVAPAVPSIGTPAPQAPGGAQQAAQADGSKYPTTWKKGLETHWNTLAPEVKAEILRREGNFASGVSTYKQEWDRAKPLIDAIAPYKQILDQNKIEPAQHVKYLLDIHHQLVTGNPQQKAAMMYNLFRGSGVSPEMLFVQGQDGKVYFNPNLANAAPQQQAPQQQSVRPEDVKKMVDEHLSVAQSNREIDQFLSQTEKYPHAKEVAPTMAQLLEANLADDLPSAYDAALRLPQHAALFEASQKQAREAAEKASAEAKRAAAEAARRKAVSVRSSSPTSVASASNGKKSLRESIAENVDAVVGGRV